MPRHHHPPGHHRPHHHHHHHHHGLQISGGGGDATINFMERFFDRSIAIALVNQAMDSPREPTALFFQAAAQTKPLGDLLEAEGIDLKAIGKRIIDPQSEQRRLVVADAALAPLWEVFPKDSDELRDGLIEGPEEMCAVAIAQALIMHLLAELIRIRPTEQ